jgi:hypothetical protein
MSDGLYTPIERCAGCAFTPGTVANGNESTQLTVNLCIEACRPFHCHERVHELQREGLTEEIAIEQAKAEGNFPVCRGFADAIETLEAKGRYDEGAEWKRDLAGKLLDVWDEAKENAYTPERAEARLHQVMREFLA